MWPPVTLPDRRHQICSHRKTSQLISSRRARVGRQAPFSPYVNTSWHTLVLPGAVCCHRTFIYRLPLVAEGHRWFNFDSDEWIWGGRFIAVWTRMLWTIRWVRLSPHAGGDCIIQQRPQMEQTICDRVQGEKVHHHRVRLATMTNTLKVSVMLEGLRGRSWHNKCTVALDR